MIDLDVITQIESNGNPKAFNATSGARGLCQITQVCLDDFNQRNPATISSERLFEPDVNLHIANWYLNDRIPDLLKAFDLPVTVDYILGAFNWGVGNMAKFFHHPDFPLPQETKNYITKYKQLVNQRSKP